MDLSLNFIGCSDRFNKTDLAARCVELLTSFWVPSRRRQTILIAATIKYRWYRFINGFTRSRLFG